MDNLHIDLLSLALGILVGFAIGGMAVRMLYSRFISDNERLQIQNQELLQTSARLEAEKVAAESLSRQHKSDIADMEKTFSLKFENLANRIFDEKTTAFKKESQEGLGQMLAPLKERLMEFQKKVDTSFGDQAKEQFSLRKEIENIVAVNRQMSTQTENLTKALKGDVKAQGNWGEIILERILEDSGLRPDIDYITQGSDMGLKHVEHGRTLKPDVIIKLPEQKHVIVDSKVSLTDYERYCAANDDAERTLHLKSFILSIKAHVNGLEERRYQDTEKLGTPDLVLMFMPIEGAYSLAIQHDTELHSYAWNKKVAIVSPTTLMITLKTIASVWRVELQNRNTLEIARQGGALYDKIAVFVKDMEDLGKKIGAVSGVYDQAFKNLTTGPGNILKRTQDLEALGVKASKALPRSDETGT